MANRIWTQTRSIECCFAHRDLMVYTIPLLAERPQGIFQLRLELPTAVLWAQKGKEPSQIVMGVCAANCKIEPLGGPKEEPTLLVEPSNQLR